MDAKMQVHKKSRKNIQSTVPQSLPLYNTDHLIPIKQAIMPSLHWKPLCRILFSSFYPLAPPPLVQSFRPSFSFSLFIATPVAARPLPPSQAVLVGELCFWTAREVDGGFMLLVAVDVLQVDHHMQGVGQHQEQDERGHQAHQDGRGQEGGTVAGRRKLLRLHVEGLDLEGEE